MMFRLPIPHVHTIPYTRISSQVGLCRLLRHEEGTSMGLFLHEEDTVLLGNVDLLLSSTSSGFLDPRQIRVSGLSMCD